MPACHTWNRWNNWVMLNHVSNWCPVPNLYGHTFWNCKCLWLINLVFCLPCSTVCTVTSSTGLQGSMTKACSCFHLIYSSVKTTGIWKGRRGCKTSFPDSWSKCVQITRVTSIKYIRWEGRKRKVEVHLKWRLQAQELDYITFCYRRDEFYISDM